MANQQAARSAARRYNVDEVINILFESDGSDAEMGIGDSSGGETDSDDDYEVSEAEYIDFEVGEDLAYFMLLRNNAVVM